MLFVSAELGLYFLHFTLNSFALRVRNRKKFWANLRHVRVTDDIFSWTSNPCSIKSPYDVVAGSYYIYFEASSPAQPGDRAILETRPDLSGCFCLHFSHHHNVRYVADQPTKHRLSVLAGEVEVFSRVMKNNSWMNYSVQIDSASTMKVYQ